MKEVGFKKKMHFYSRLAARASLLVLFLVALPALAQDAGLEKRLELAKKMHDLRPTKDQVETAIDQMATTQPPENQEPFKVAMRNALNYQAIEKISVDAMAEVYSEAELQAMLDYYSKPEAKSAAAKDPDYAKKVYPEITRMLDQAMMHARTGGQ